MNDKGNRKLSIAEHKELGTLLEMARLYNLNRMIDKNIFSTKTLQRKSKEAKIQKLIITLKDLLDNQFFKQYPKKVKDMKLKIYFGNKEAEKRLSKK